MKIVYEVEGHRYLVQYYAKDLNVRTEDAKWRDSTAFESFYDAIERADELASRYDKVRVVDRGE